MFNRNRGYMTRREREERRNRNIKAAIGIGGICLGYALGNGLPVFNNNQSASTEPENPVIETYGEGAILPLPMEAVVSGWQIIIPNFEEVHVPEATDVDIKVSTSGNSASFSSSGLGSGVYSRHNGSLYLALGAGDWNGGPIPIVVNYSNFANDTKYTQVFHVQPNYYPEISEDPGVAESDEQDYSGILSEVDLPNKTLANIKKYMKMFGYDDGVLIYKNSNATEEGEYDPKSDTVALSSASFTESVKNPQIGYMLLTHELAHRFANDLKDSGTKQKYIRNLSTIAEKIAKKAGVEMPYGTGLFGPSDEIENNKLFRLFDESWYTKEKREPGSSGTGHPYSNFDEFFASATTVLRFFPEEFTKQAKQMNVDNIKLFVEYLSAMRSAYDFGLYSDFDKIDSSGLMPKLNSSIKELEEELSRRGVVAPNN